MIKEGDYVNTKTANILFQSRMNVLEINGDKALCQYFNSNKNELLEKVFDVNELTLEQEKEDRFGD
ncbi:MAG: hypothetical protein H7Z76_14180 [Methylotenera sp.]|nr:hypothetical protein [Flavobacterium sp.]